MKKILLASVLALGLATTFTSAKAHFVLADETFADLGGTGFGVLPRLLTLQNSPNESGAVISNGGATGFLSPVTFSGPNGTVVTGTSCTSNGTCTGGLQVNESHLVNIATFGWTSGANVGIGLDTNQPGATTGLDFNNLTLQIFNSAGVQVGSFGSTNPVVISPELLAQQQGNGNSVFDLRLSPDEQLQFNAMLTANPGALFAGLAASFGCTPTGCAGNSFDGAESFLGFNTAAVPGPIAGAGLPGVLAMLGGMIGLNRWRKRRVA